MDVKILVVGDSPATPTGLAYVSSYLSKMFSESSKFVKVGYFVNRGTLKEEQELKALDNGSEELKNVEIFIPTKNPATMSDFDNVIETFNPNIVFTVQDPWHLEVIAFSKYRYSYFWIA